MRPPRPLRGVIAEDFVFRGNSAAYLLQSFHHHGRAAMPRRPPAWPAPGARRQASVGYGTRAFWDHGDGTRPNQ
jgi:hypothetical protein